MEDRVIIQGRNVLKMCSNKSCLKRGTYQSIKNFSPRESSGDGHQHWCKPCMSIASLKSQAKARAERIAKLNGNTGTPQTGSTSLLQGAFSSGKTVHSILSGKPKTSKSSSSSN